MILVTGANGFVGSALIERLVTEGRSVKAASRGGRGNFPEQVVDLCIGDLGAMQDWGQALVGVEVVVHSAARVHVMRDRAAKPLEAFRRVNVDGTLNLARQAAASGVRRFVYISSAKVNGEVTSGQSIGRGLNERVGFFTEVDEPKPVDAYGLSKLEAEQGLRQIAAETGMDVVIIRPPLVYGPGVRANFAALLKAVRLGYPLPFGAIDNKRSLVALGNLVDFIVTCIAHPSAANQVFLVSDGEDVSTPELIRRIAERMGRPARLFPLPVWILHFGARLIGRADMAQRVCSSLRLDISKARRLLGWSPPFGLDEGLAHAIQGHV